MNETIQTSPPPELLDLVLASVDTSFPVLQPGLYELVVKEASVEKTAAGDGEMLVVQLATTQPSRDVKGNTLNPGTVLFHRVGLKPTDKYDHLAIVKNVARVTQAMKPQVSMKADSIFNGFNSACKAFVGRLLTAKIETMPAGVDKKSGRSLPPTNAISQFEKAQ